ncbi:hypothetical protein SeMB42_g06968 [Synchytrium endobioticum]|nr:hypothetical protein SeMB42_g07386 [Synchytrium endobioticum]TPX37273.1 hypothetical protein SeMB42_g06968 [Synchytrium endobioticum]
MVANCAKTVTVQSGDTLTFIAVTNGWAAARDLLPLNPGLDINAIISPGQMICVAAPGLTPAGTPVGGQPKGSPMPSPTTNSFPSGAPDVNPQEQCIKTVKIVAGDTCFSLAVSNNFQGTQPGTKLQSVNKALVNRVVDCANLPIGEKVCVDCYATPNIPETSNCPYHLANGCKRTTTIKAGDTLTNIAMSAGLASLKDLVAINPGLQPDATIYPGNNLCVLV